MADDRAIPGPALPDELAEKVSIGELIGEGAQGRTYRGTFDDFDAAVKVLTVPDIAQWKDLELFEREISVLHQLAHPRIPRIFASHADVESGALWMVREFVPGESMHEVLEREELLDPAEARAFMLQMLEILEYLHSLLPAVVHRDIKPQNIIRRPDGSYVLIDFGAASATARLTGGSTFVGTNGYMPAEQLMGRADARSDLYALGATTIQLLSGHHPSNLIGAGMRMRTDVLHDDAHGLRGVLERLVEPMPERRYQTAKRVRESLDGSGALVLAEEHVGDLVATRTGETLTIELPPLHRYYHYGVLGCLAYILLSSKGFAILLLTGFAVATSIAFIAVRLWYRRRFTLTPDALIYERQFGRLPARRKATLALDDVVACDRAGAASHLSKLSIMTRDGTRRLTAFGVAPKDLEWLAEQIRIWKEEHAR